MWTPLQQLLKLLSRHEQRVFFDGVLFDLARIYLPISPVQVDGLDTNPKNDRSVGGVAAMISKLVEHNPILEEHVESWLTDTTGEYATVGLNTRRAVIATLAVHQGKYSHGHGATSDDSRQASECAQSIIGNIR